MSKLNKPTFVAVVPVNQTTTLGREEVLASREREPPKLNLREVPLLLASKLLISLQLVYRIVRTMVEGPCRALI